MITDNIVGKFVKGYTPATLHNVNKIEDKNSPNGFKYYCEECNKTVKSLKHKIRGDKYE